MTKREFFWIIDFNFTKLMAYLIERQVITQHM